FIMPNCRSAWTVATGSSRHSRIGELSRASFLARDIACLVPLNLTRVGGTIEDAERRLQSLPVRLRQAVEAAIELAQWDLLHPIERSFFDNSPPSDLLNIPALLH